MKHFHNCAVYSIKKKHRARERPSDEMNFSAWFSQVTHRKPVDPRYGCQGIQPLLSLYSDKMTAPAESARVEAHLLTCEDCRRALSWMQATNAVLAHREPVLPPPDMALRIRGAIADLEAGTRARPSRALLVYRPVFAAAFTILIGAVVVAQLTLHHHGARTTPGGVNQVAMNPSTPALSPSPSPIFKPGVPAIAPIRRHADARVATRLPAENTVGSKIGIGAPPPIVDRTEPSDSSDVKPIPHLKPLPEVRVSADAHVQSPRTISAKNGGAIHGTHKTQPAPAPEPAKHSDDNALMANRDAGTHDDTADATAPTPEPATAPDTVRLATTDTHPADVLSGVRSKVNYMRTVNFTLPSSARSVQASGRAPINAANSTVSAEYLSSESGTAPIVRQ